MIRRKEEASMYHMRCGNIRGNGNQEKLMVWGNWSRWMARSMRASLRRGKGMAKASSTTPKIRRNTSMCTRQENYRSASYYYPQRNKIVLGGTAKGI